MSCGLELGLDGCARKIPMETSHLLVFPFIISLRILNELYSFPKDSSDVEANKFWASEYDSRRRISSAIGQVHFYCD